MTTLTFETAVDVRLDLEASGGGRRRILYGRTVISWRVEFMVRGWGVAGVLLSVPRQTVSVKISDDLDGDTDAIDDQAVTIEVLSWDCPDQEEIGPARQILPSEVDIRIDKQDGASGRVYFA